MPTKLALIAALVPARRLRRVRRRDAIDHHPGVDVHHHDHYHDDNHDHDDHHHHHHHDHHPADDDHPADHHRPGGAQQCPVHRRASLPAGLEPRHLRRLPRIRPHRRPAPTSGESMYLFTKCHINI